MKHHDVSAARQKTSGAALVKLLGFVILSCHLSELLSSQSEFSHLFPTSRPSCLKNEGNDACSSLTLLAIENYLLVVEEIKRCGYITASYKTRLFIGLF